MRSLLAMFVACGAPPAVAQVCLSTNIQSTAGEIVTSPFGVDRTGRASAGWHQGLDIANARGKGDPVYSGSNGTATYRRQERGAGMFMTITSGDMRYLYMHLQNARTDLSGKAVQAGEQIGEQGCTGMQSCAPHLHLGAQMKGSALRQSGAQGRVWQEGGTKLSTPLTGDAIKSALPTAWYLVNPEPFLPHQIPIDGSGGKQAVYGPQMGGWRSQTLPRTCSPDQTIVDNPRIASTTDTGAAGAAVDSQATLKSGTEGYAANAAGQDRHGVVVELARLSAADMTAAAQLAQLNAEARRDSALAHLLVATVEQGRGGGR